MRRPSAVVAAADAVRKETSLCPPGLVPVLWEGEALLSLRAFTVRRGRLAVLPWPALTFAQSNLRTYVRGPRGRPGVWFFSLDAASTWITIGARLLLGAPYFRAELGIAAGDGVRYFGKRTGAAPAAYRLRVPHLRRGVPPGQHPRPVRTERRRRNLTGVPP